MNATMFQHLRVDRHGALTVARFADKRLVDEIQIHEISKELNRLTEQDNPRIVLDMGNVEHMSSPMIGKLILFQQRLQRNQGSLRLCNLSNSVEQILGVCNLQTYFLVSKEFDRVIQAEAKLPEPLPLASEPPKPKPVATEPRPPSISADIKPVLQQLAEIIHCVEYLQKTTIDLSNMVISLAETHGLMAKPKAQKRPPGEAKPDFLKDTAEQPVWKPGG